MQYTTIHKRLYRIAVRELRHIATRPIYLFCMVIAPVFCYVFFTTLMANGLPTNMPAGGQYGDYAKHHPQFGCIPANACHGSLCKFPRSTQGGPAWRDLCFLLHTRRHHRGSYLRKAAPRVVLHQLRVPHRRVVAVPRPAHDVGTCFGCHRAEHAFSQGGYRRAGNGVSPARRY